MQKVTEKSLQNRKKNTSEIISKNRPVNYLCTQNVIIYIEQDQSNSSLKGNITFWFATSDAIVNVTEMSKNVRVSNSITGATTVDNANFSVVMITAAIGIAALTFLAVYALKRRKREPAKG